LSREEDIQGTFAQIISQCAIALLQPNKKRIQREAPWMRFPNAMFWQLTIYAVSKYLLIS
jgi:hypothetical protein